MNVTAIRFRKLVSTDRYGHIAVEIEAQLQAGDELDASMNSLRALVEAQLHGAEERDRIYASLNSMREETAYLEERRDGLRADIKANREIIRKHRELEALAVNHSIDPAGLNGEIPF